MTLDLSDRPRRSGDPALFEKNSLSVAQQRKRNDSSDNKHPALICIDPAHVLEVWPLARPFILAAMHRAAISDFADVESAVLAGTSLLWLAVEETNIHAAAITALHRVNGDRLCTIVACGGRGRARWLALKSVLEDFARAEGCRAIRILGRRGWARLLSDYATTRILMEKELL
jgi:hypothetical protein